MQNNLKEYKGIEKLIFSKEHGIKAIKYQILPLRFKSVMFRTNKWHVCVTSLTLSSFTHLSHEESVLAENLCQFLAVLMKEV